jgi:hypothetical protein
MTTDDNCGWPTASGDACRNPASGDDGRCWIPSHGDEGAENPHGRPTKLTHQRQEVIAGAIEAGHSFRAACEQAGISKQTGHRWMKTGEGQDEGIFNDFHDRITRARGVGKVEIERSIVDICRDRQDASTLLRYLKHIEGGHAAAEDDELAGINLIVPEIAKRDE